MEWAAVLESSIMLFAIVNPIGSIPIFLQLTSSMAPREKKRTFRVRVVKIELELFSSILIGIRLELKPAFLNQRCIRVISRILLLTIKKCVISYYHQIE